MYNHYDRNDVFDAEQEHRYFQTTIRHESKYRANPDNRYHRMYQKACNRWFWVSIVFLLVSFWPLFPDALTAVTFLFAMFLIGIVILWAVGQMLIALVDAWDWLSASER